MFTFMLIMLALMFNALFGIFVVRYTIGPGLGIIIGDGFPAWIMLVAIMLWPIVVLYWFWLVMTTIPRNKK